MSKKALNGSNVLPAVVALLAGVEVQLGAIVARAHSASGLSVDDWNALTDADREAKLDAALQEMRAEAQAKAEAAAAAEADAAEKKWQAESVEALVLSDSIYGKCGEVKRFHKSEVKAIAAAGYVDPHPNAVKAARAKAED